MPTLGLPYSIMYQSRGRSGLRDVVAYVRKPDDSTVGAFPMVEGEGMWVGCYFTHYYSSIFDPEGKYYARTISPSEGVNDVLGFELVKGDLGPLLYIPPSGLHGTIHTATVRGYVQNSLELTAGADHAALNGHVDKAANVDAAVSNVAVSGFMSDGAESLEGLV